MADGALIETTIPEIEQEVLGTILLTGNAKLVYGLVEPKHFVEPVHRLIFERILLADERYKTARGDVVFQLFQKDEAEHWGKIVGVPLSTYLTRLAANCVRGAKGIRDSVFALHQQSARIALGDVGAQIAAAAKHPECDPSQLRQETLRVLDDVGSTLKGARGKTQFSIGESTRNALAEVRAAKERGGLAGITWGLTDLNAATGGLGRGEMTVLGARPSMGKSLVGLSVALSAAKAGHGAGFVSLEMGSTALSKRALSDFAYDWNVRVPYNDLSTSRVSEEDLSRLEAMAKDFERLPLRIEEQSGLSVAEIGVKVERMAEMFAQAGVRMGLLVVDYLQLVKPGARYQGNKVAEVTEISAGLRNLAKEHGIAVLALAQLSRQIESRPLHERRPTLSDLRESGAIEQDADVVCFLFREAYYLQRERGKNNEAEQDRLERLIDVQNKLEFIIAKSRNGPTKTVELFVDMPFSAVRNAARFDFPKE